MKNRPIVMDDPVPDPYPEFEAEVFELYRDEGLAPEDLRDPDERQRYAAWLAKQKQSGSQD